MTNDLRGVNTLCITTLAQWYFGTSDSRNARRRMLYLLTSDPVLWAGLQERNFRKHQVYFTPLQYELLVELYGFPPYCMVPEVLF